MPNVYLRNDTEITIHASFWGAPTSSQNNIKPGTTWTRADMPSMPYTIEIRKAEGGKPFTMNETGEKAGQIMGAVAAGSASVLVGGVTAMGSLQGGPQKGYDTAGQLMNTAGEGGKDFDTEYDGFLVRANGVGIGAEERTFVVRLEEGQYAILDESSGGYLALDKQATA